MFRWVIRALKNRPITAIFIGVTIGIILGLLLKYFTVQPWYPRDIMYIKFPGEIFLRLVNCLILPLITSSIISATCNLYKSGPIGLMALYYYLTTTSLGIMLSIVLVQSIRPGELLRDKGMPAVEAANHSLTIDTLLDLVRNLLPDNIVNACLTQFHTLLEQPKSLSAVRLEEWSIIYEETPAVNVLGLVFISIILGIALGRTDEQGKPLRNFFHCLSKVIMNIMNCVIMVAPIGVLFLIAGRILEIDDFVTTLKQLGAYVLTVLIGLIIQGFVILPMLYFIAIRKSPYKIIAKVGPALATACGTSSSTATVPVTLRCLEYIGIDKKVANFVVPIGATINMDGIALYESIGAIFIIQLRGLPFSLFKIIIVNITCTLSCIGAAGLPNGGYVMLIMVLNSVGVPVEDVALIIAIDCFVDRFRTTINIISDALGSCIIAHFYKNYKESSFPKGENEPLSSNPEKELTH